MRGCGSAPEFERKNRSASRLVLDDYSTVPQSERFLVTAFIVLPITRDIATQVRASRRAPRYGHPVHQEVATGTGPCRECLSSFAVGVDERLLFTHSPFDGVTMLSQPGPVFIHAAACPRHEGAGYPEGLAGIPMVAQAYREDGSVGPPILLRAGAEANALTALLEAPAVGFVHLRHAEAGCFIARVERVAV